MNFSRRAIRAQAALRRCRPRGGLPPRERGWRPQRPWTHLWPFSQVLCASLALLGPASGWEAGASRSGREESDVLEDLAALSCYWNGSAAPGGYESAVRPPLGTGGDRYYDDNAWVALALVQRWRMSKDAWALERAREVLEFVLSGWDEQDTNPLPGGVRWTESRSNSDRCTVSTGTAAELCTHLYLTDGDKHCLEWAERLYDWASRSLLSPNGLYWDHVDDQGRIDRRQWSYNQGVMIGAASLLGAATGSSRYKSDAAELCSAALSLFSEGHWYNQPVVFNSIFVRSLLMSEGMGLSVRSGDVLLRYASSLCEPRARLQSSGGLVNRAARVGVLALTGWPADAYTQLA